MLHARTTRGLLALLPLVLLAGCLEYSEELSLEKDGSGTATLYNLPDNRLALRFDDFEVSHNTELYVWLSESANPKTSAEAVEAPRTDIGVLKSTLGAQNYVLPAEVTRDKVHSIVIWCAPVRIAYSAAALTPL